MHTNDVVKVGKHNLVLIKQPTSQEVIILIENKKTSLSKCADYSNRSMTIKNVKRDKHLEHLCK